MSEGWSIPEPLTPMQDTPLSARHDFPLKEGERAARACLEFPFAGR